MLFGGLKKYRTTSDGLAFGGELLFVQPEQKLMKLLMMNLKTKAQC